MSGPVVPPLEVTEVDGSPDGRPITKIIVSNGDLSISGRTATIDTSGAGGLPGTPAQSIQFNSDPAGTFTGSERLLFETGSNQASIYIKSGASATQAEIKAVDGWGLQISATDTDNSIRNQIVIYGENDGPDGILLVPNTGENVRLYTGGLTTSASDGDLVLSTYDDEDKAKITLTAGAGGGVVIQTDAAGFLQLENTTTDADSVLSIMGNGTGDAKLDLQNASERVWVLMDENKKLKIQGGTGGNTFIIDVSGAATGITFPDGTTQTTAASGGGGFIPATPDGVTGPRFLLAPIGTMGATDGQQPSVGYLYACPFIGPKGDLSLTTDTSGGCSIRVVTGAASSSIIIGVYDADSGNNPQTLLATSTFDVALSGQQTNAWDSAVTLNEGEMYFVAWLRPSDESGTVEIRSWESAEVPALGWRNAIMLYNMVYDIENSPMTSMPATFGTPDGTNGALPSVGVVI